MVGRLLVSFHWHKILITFALVGFSIIDIIENNPRTVTVYFGGERGKRIRDNYMALTVDSADENGQVKQKFLFPEIKKYTRSYVFKSSDGLLHQTQFTQVALALMELARFHDMKENNLVCNNSTFAGHSLGEFIALAAVGEVFSADEVASIVFYRGLTMQAAVESDENGNSYYSMAAVNPSKISKGMEHLSPGNEYLLIILVKQVSPRKVYTIVSK